MPWIQFKKPRDPIEVPDGANLLKILLSEGVPVASSCGGEGVCIKCLIEIVEGAAHLSEPNQAELNLRATHEIPRSQRVSCQTTIHGDITIDTDYW